MKTTIEITTPTGTAHVTIFSKLHAEGVKFPNETTKTGMLHNQFKITVKTCGKQCTFDFYDSYANYRDGIQDLTEQGLKGALECLLSDGSSGAMDFEQFCSEFGYDTDSRSAERIHKACMKSAKHINRLFGESAMDIHQQIAG